MSREYRIGDDLRGATYDAAVQELWARFSTEEFRILKLRREKPNIPLLPDDGPVLFAGPWIGEFGWELARWQGGIRRIARQTGAYMIVMGDPGHDVLYEFASEYWEVPPFFTEAGFTRQCDHVRGGPETPDYLGLLQHLIAGELLAYHKVDIVVPRKFSPDEQDIVGLKTDAVGWSAGYAGRPYFCLIPRLRGWNSYKNWPVENWRRLIFDLVGPRGAWAVVGTRDEVRALDSGCGVSPDQALRRSIDLLTHAQFAIASESGGALLSLLCGCPTLILGHPSREKRITQDENFLNTPVRYLAREGYHFTVQEVAAAARDFSYGL